MQSYLKSGSQPIDGRGRSKNCKHRLKDEVIQLVYNHIRSFKGRRSHYSLKDSKRVYLPDELNIKKCI